MIKAAAQVDPEEPSGQAAIAGSWLLKVGPGTNSIGITWELIAMRRSPGPSPGLLNRNLGVLTGPAEWCVY